MQTNNLKDYEGHTVSKEAFHAAIRRLEQAYNAGCTAVYDPAANVTRWFIASDCVGLSNGNIGQASMYSVKKG